MNWASAATARCGSRSTDTVIGGKVTATLVDTADLQSNAFKVVVERGNVYLMGRVTEREASRGTEIARSVTGVQKVVQVFEITDRGRNWPPWARPPPAPAAAASAPR